jgi:hypothetical protein
MYPFIVSPSDNLAGIDYFLLDLTRGYGSGEEIMFFTSICSSFLILYAMYYI